MNGHAILATLAIGFAFVAWKNPQLTQSSIVMVKSEPIEKIIWQDDAWKIELFKRTQEVLVTITPLHQNNTEQNTSIATVPKTFVGTKQASELFDKLLPLKAVRVLGEPKQDFGLNPPSAKLILGSHEINIGKNTYGSGDLYAEIHGTAYLIKAANLSSFRYGGVSLQDRRVLRIDRKNINKILLTRGLQKRELLQRHSDEPEQAFFAHPAEPDQKIPYANDWIERLLTLTVIDTTTQKPTSEKTFSVTFYEHQQGPTTLDVWLTPDRKAFAKLSQSNVVWVLSEGMLATLSQDLDRVLK